MRELTNRDELPTAVADALDDVIAELDGLLPTVRNGVLDARPTGFDFVPVGSIVLWPTGSTPAGWLRCNGATVNRQVYATLFNALGITFGAGNGSTTFTLPTIADVGTARYIIATGVKSL